MNNLFIKDLLVSFLIYWNIQYSLNKYLTNIRKKGDNYTVEKYILYI